MQRKYFALEKQILIKDTNVMGNTYFANYVVWQGEAREKCLMSHPSFRAEIEKNQHVHMVTHSLQHKFLKETTMGDLIEIRASAKNIQRFSFEMIFGFYNKITEDLIGEGSQRVAFINRVSGEYCEIPRFILDLVNEYRED